MVLEILRSIHCAETSSVVFHPSLGTVHLLAAVKDYGWISRKMDFTGKSILWMSRQRVLVFHVLSF